MTAPDRPRARTGRARLPRRLRRVGVAVAVVSLLSGCAQIPAEGRPEGLTAPSAEAEPVTEGVRVSPEGPHADDDIYQIVYGFLEATGTAEADFATAREYLTPRAAQRWDAQEGITIYDHTGMDVSDDDGADRMEFTAPAVGAVGADGSFTAAEPDGQVEADFDLVRVDGQWRISDLEPGIYVSAQDFAREYSRVRRYFFEPRRAVLVPDPVFLPTSRKLPGELVRALLDGPSDWLVDALSTEVPAGTELVEPVTVNSEVAEVRLSSQAGSVVGVSREEMIAQIVRTLTELPGIAGVRVYAGSTLLTLGDRGQHTRADLRRFRIADERRAQEAYLLRDGQVFTVGRGPEEEPTPGPLDPQVPLSAVAAAPDGSTIAGVSADGARLLVAAVDEPAETEQRLTGTGLRSPSFDQFGNLWVVEGDGAAARIRWLPEEGEAKPVEIPDLPDAQVRALRVADDGTRVAFVDGAEDAARIFVGAVDDLGDRLVVSGLREVGRGLVGARDLAWADTDELVVLAAEPKAQPQPFFVTIDGYRVRPAEPLGEMSSITIAPDEPMLAGTAKGAVWRLPPGGSWLKIGAGSSPTYPG